MNHPDELELYEFALSDLDNERFRYVQEHVSQCQECERFVSMARTEKSVPAMNGALLQKIATCIDSPVSGDVWKLEWDAAAIIAVVRGVSNTDLVVVPVDIGAHQLHGHTKLLSSDDGPFAFDVTLWPRLAVEVPLGVLALKVGSVEAPVLESATTNGLDSFDSASAYDTNDAEEAWATGLELAQLLSYLQGARQCWLPHQIEGLQELMRKQQITRSALATKAGIAAAELTDIIRGRVQVSEQLITSLAAALEVDRGQLIGDATSVNANLLYEIEKPARRNAFAHRAALAGTSEAEARLAVFGLAARSTGDASIDRDWGRLVDDYLDD